MTDEPGHEFTRGLYVRIAIVRAPGGVLIGFSGPTD
jgi:hypothetical protein